MKSIFLTVLLFFSTLAAGQNWQQVGDFTRSPRRLFTDTIDNLLYIGGEFKTNGNDTLNGVCFWDNTAIQAMDAGLYDACGSNSCQAPEMFIRYKNEIYTGSNFDEIAGQPSSGIARWNGNQWLPVSPGLFNDDGDGGQAWGAYEHDGLLYVVGPFRLAGQDTANSVASWDGTNWKTYDAPEDTQHDIPLHGRIIFYKDEMYVGGNCYNVVDGNINFDIMRYNGTAWHQVGNGLHGGLSTIFKMLIYQGDLYVCGRFNTSSGNAGNGIMRWDGEQWHDVGGGLCFASDFITDMLVYKNKLYLVGIFTCIGNGLTAKNLAVWDGKQWCNFGDSDFDNKINCIEVYNDEIYVGGGFKEISGYPVKYFAKYIGDHSIDTCSTFVSMAPDLQRMGQLLINPNPVKDQVTISSSFGSPLLTAWRVFNAAGQEVTAWVNPVGSSSLQQVLEVQNLPAGVYYLQGLGQTGMATGKFVKM